MQGCSCCVAFDTVVSVRKESVVSLSIGMHVSVNTPRVSLYNIALVYRAFLLKT